MEIVYGRSLTPDCEGRHFRNSRIFTDIIPGATLVIVHGDHPAIVKAYRAAGIKVVEVGAPMALPPLPAAPVVERPLDIPENWRDLSWQQRRSIASSVSDEPIINSEGANAAIVAELARRQGYFAEPVEAAEA